MAEPHRVSFTTLGSAKKQSKSKPKSDTVRITINLTEPSGDSCPVFSYTALVNSVEKKKKKENEKHLNGSIDHIHDCDDDQLKKIALQYENKYGTKENRFSNYKELGAGYDDNDSFIDNTEALDEALSEQMETEYGGYYVNVGPLQLRQLEGSEHSDDEELNRTHSLKRAAKAIVSDSEEEESDSGEEDEEEGKDEDSREDNQTSAKENKSPAGKVVESMVVCEEKSDVLKNETDKVRNKPNGEIKTKKIKQKRKREQGLDAPLEKKKKKLSKSLTVKKLLEEKRIAEAPSEYLDKEESKIIHNSVNDVIESVINASRTVPTVLFDSDNSDGSKSSSSLSRNGDLNELREETIKRSPPESQVPSISTSQMNLNNDDVPPLPKNIPPDILELFNFIKQSAINCRSGKSKFFTSEINAKLLSLECKCREHSNTFGPSLRHIVYTRLSYFLPCGKETLKKRAKTLLTAKEEEKSEHLIAKLKTAINRIMPSLLEKHSEACQKASKEKYIDDSVSGCASSNSETKPKGSKVPRRVFPWNDELRNCVRQIIDCRLRIFKLVKGRKDNVEEFTHSFINSKLKPLWPIGWMKVSTILKVAESQPGFAPKKNASSGNYQKKTASALNNSGPNMSLPANTPVASTPVPESKKSTNVSSSTSSVNSFKDKFKQSETSLPEIDMFSDPIDLLSKITSAISPDSAQQQANSNSCIQQLPSPQRQNSVVNLHTSPNSSTKVVDCKKPSSDSVISKNNNYNVDSLIDYSKKESSGNNNSNKSSSNSRPVSQSYPKSSNDQVLDLSPVKSPVVSQNHKNSETVSSPLAVSATANNHSSVSNSDKSVGRATFPANSSYVPHVSPTSSVSHILPTSCNVSQGIPSQHTSPTSLQYSHATSVQQSLQGSPSSKHPSASPPKLHPSSSTNISPNPAYQTQSPPKSANPSSTHSYKNIHPIPNSNSYPVTVTPVMPNISNPSFVPNNSTSAHVTLSAKPSVNIGAISSIPAHLSSSYELSVDRVSNVNKSGSYSSSKNMFISPPTPVSAQTSPPKEGTKHVSLKHRILQESMKDQAEMESSHSPNESKLPKSKLDQVEVNNRSLSGRDVLVKNDGDNRRDVKKSVRDDTKEETTNYKREAELEAERRMIEETMTATDVLNQIINESLNDSGPRPPVVLDEIKPLYHNETMKPPPPSVNEDLALQERKARSQSVEECEASMEAVIRNLQDLQAMSGSKLQNNSECNFNLPSSNSSSKYTNDSKTSKSDDVSPTKQNKDISPKPASIPKVDMGYQAEFFKHLLSDSSSKEKISTLVPEIPEAFPSIEDNIAKPLDPNVKNKGYPQPSSTNHRSVIVPVSSNQSGWQYRDQNYYRHEPS